MSQLVFNIHGNPEEVGSNAMGGMGLLERAILLLLCVFYNRLPAEGVAQIEGGSSHLKDPESK